MRRLKMTIGKYRIRKIDELNLVMEEKRVITEKKLLPFDSFAFRLPFVAQ